jgi:hypothetical protein
MYPSKGRSGNGTLSFAFDTHDAAAAREKRQEINVTLPGFAWFIIFAKYRLSPTECGAPIQLYYWLQSSGYPHLYDELAITCQ